MADIKKIATRVSYGNTLVELAQQGADNLVVFDADLAAATKTEIFRRRYGHDGLCPLRVQLCHVRCGPRL